MRAFVRVRADDQVVEQAEVPAPEAGAEEVLVAVEAFGVGVHDRYFIPADARFPYPIGIEGAGVVVAVGEDVKATQVGDRVLVSAALNPHGGTWAELVAVPEAGTSPMPGGMDFTTAAGITVAGKSAVESLHTLGLQPGATLYVAGASGAIGSLVVQMAAAQGVRVAGSASTENHDHLLALGAELVVDYRDAAWPDAVRAWAPGGVDAALAIQPGTAPSSLAVTRDGGHVVTVSGDPCPPERGVRVEQFAHRPDASADMAQLVADIAAGRIRLVLGHVYAFDDALVALERTETRHGRGKLVVLGPGRPAPDPTSTRPTGG